MTSPTRRRALTLVEVMVSLSLIAGLMLVIGTGLKTALTFNHTAVDAVSRTQLTQLLSARLGKEARSAQPVAELSLMPAGGLIEGRVPGAVSVWSEAEALILRRADGYTILQVEGRVLVARRISRRGRVVSGPLLGNVREATFSVERNPDGQPVGIAYAAEFARGGSGRGFVALRTVPAPSQPFTAPSLAPRFGDR